MAEHVDLREAIARRIEQQLQEWIELGDERPPFPLHSEHWLVQRAYERAAETARNYNSEDDDD